MIHGEILEIMVDIHQRAVEMVDFEISVVGTTVMEHHRFIRILWIHKNYIFSRIIVDDVMIEEIIMTVVILSLNVIIIDDVGTVRTGVGHLKTDCDQFNTASIKN